MPTRRSFIGGIGSLGAFLGSTEHNSYINSHFGFSFTKPDDWLFMTPTQFEQVVRTDQRAYTGSESSDFYEKFVGTPLVVANAPEKFQLFEPSVNVLFDPPGTNFKPSETILDEFELEPNAFAPMYTNLIVVKNGTSLATASCNNSKVEMHARYNSRKGAHNIYWRSVLFATERAELTFSFTCLLEEKRDSQSTFDRIESSIRIL